MNLNTLKALTWTTVAAAVASALALAAVAPTPTRAAVALSRSVEAVAAPPAAFVAQPAASGAVRAALREEPRAPWPRL